MTSTTDLTRAQEVAVEAVRRAWVADEHGDGSQEHGHGGDRFEVYAVKPGEHPLGEGDRCQACGAVQVDTETYRARKEAENGRLNWDHFKDTCFDAAIFTVEFTYNSQGHRALYGVPAEGSPSLWAS